MKQDPEVVFDKLKNEIPTYLELKLELLKLNSFESAGKVISLLSYGLIITVLAFFMCLFIFLALGFFVGEYMGSTALGFIIVATIYLMLIATIRLCKKRIRENIMNVIIAALLASNVKKDE